jgi:hypothetical protein
MAAPSGEYITVCIVEDIGVLHIKKGKLEKPAFKSYFPDLQETFMCVYAGNNYIAQTLQDKVVLLSFNAVERLQYNFIRGHISKTSYEHIFWVNTGTQWLSKTLGEMTSEEFWGNLQPIRIQTLDADIKTYKRKFPAAAFLSWDRWQAGGVDSKELLTNVEVIVIPNGSKKLQEVKNTFPNFFAYLPNIFKDLDFSESVEFMDTPFTAQHLKDGSVVLLHLNASWWMHDRQLLVPEVIFDLTKIATKEDYDKWIKNLETIPYKSNGFNDAILLRYTNKVEVVFTLDDLLILMYPFQKEYRVLTQEDVDMLKLFKVIVPLDTVRINSGYL